MDLTKRQRQVLGYIAGETRIRHRPILYYFSQVCDFMVWEWSQKYECFKWVSISSIIRKLRQMKLVRIHENSPRITVAGIQALYGEVK